MLIVAGLFSANFCAWRGRAFILAIQAARESRKRRIALTNPAAETSDPFCATAPASTPASSAAPAPEEGTGETETLAAGITQVFAGTCGGGDGGGRPMPAAAAARACPTRATASINAEISASASGEVEVGPASASCAPVSSTPGSSATPLPQFTSLARELLQPTKGAVSSLVPPRGTAGVSCVGAAEAGAGTAGHEDEENVSLMRGAAGFALGGTGGGSDGDNSSRTPNYGSTIARAAEFKRASSHDGGNEAPREPDREPHRKEEQTESKAHRFLHGPSRLVHNISGRDDHSGRTDSGGTSRPPESPGGSGGVLRYLRGPSHLMHTVARGHHAHGGNESAISDDSEPLGGAKGSPESPGRNSHSHKWRRPHWHRKKHDDSK